MAELSISVGCAGCKSATPATFLQFVPDTERTEAGPGRRQIAAYATTSVTMCFGCWGGIEQEAAADSPVWLLVHGSADTLPWAAMHLARRRYSYIFR